MSYPVTTPFGQVPGYPLNNGFHNGIDYGCPMGTPVVVNGVTIGLSNNTGASTGPHLHVGRYVNGQPTDPGVGNGFNFNSAVVYDTGSDSVNGNYVRVTGDGALWNYLHLEKVLVSKGQRLEGGNVSRDNINQDELDKLVYLATGQQAKSNQNFENNLGNPLDTVLDNLMNYSETRDKQLRADAFDGLIAHIKSLESNNGQISKQAVLDYVNKNLK